METAPQAQGCNVTEKYDNNLQLYRLIHHIERTDDMDAAMTLSIALKISLIQNDDCVIAETDRYLMIALLKDHHDCPYTATREILVRMGRKLLDDRTAQE